MPARDTAVRCRFENGIAWIELNRPGTQNRIDEETAGVLCELAETIERDETVRVVMLTASGNVFCAGFAMREGEWIQHHDCISAIAALSVPVLVGLNGDALDEGAELAIAGDLRVAVSGTRLRFGHLAEGRLPGCGSLVRLPRIVGRPRALDWVLTARTVRTREALQTGLVQAVVPRREWNRALTERARLLAERAPIAMRYAKEAVHRGLDLTLEQGIRLEQDLYVLLQTTRDRQEGVKAFLEKRKPRFRGE